jgi:polysaccharide chain length determinant protein (PEP-CTERM system associated)
MDKLLEQVLIQVRATWRRRWWILLVAWIVAVGGWAWQNTLPDVYSASAQVHVNTDSVLRPLMRGMSVTPDTEQRVQMMSRTLLTRENLEKVARQVDLDLLVDGDRTMDQIVDQLSGNVRLTSGRGNDIYTVRFQHEDPKVAQDVVQAVLDMFIETGLGGARQDLFGSQRFIETQIASYRERLDEQERRIEEFKREHVGLLSSRGGNHYERMEAVEERLRAAELELREAQNQRAIYSRQVAGEEPGLFTHSQGRGAGDPELEARIQSLRRNLDELRRRYTDEHPDVQAVRRMIAELEEERDLQPTIAGGASMGGDSGDVFYQQVRLALTQAESRVAALQTRVAELREQRERLADAVDRIPRIESEFASMQRDYNVLKSNYDQLLATRERAILSREVETGAEMVDFRVLEPPRLPNAPSSPDRPILVTGVLVLGLGAGTGFAFLLAQLRATFHSPRTLTELTGRPVLGSVSRVRTAREAWRRRMAFLAFLAVAGLLAAAYAVVLLYVLGFQGYIL